jgi:pSer/pThr/pTyr-binding forkhead associated (FHA) protein
VSFEQDRHVSPQHARVFWKGGAPVLEDLGSKNGTYLNTSDEERLKHGDYVQVGSELLRVEINE